MKSLRDALKTWTDIDGAQFALAKLLGLINENETFQDTKHLWWTDNDIGCATACLLEEMEDAGLVEKRDEPDDQYRWVMKSLESLIPPPKVEQLHNAREIYRITTTPVKVIKVEREPFVITEGNPEYMDDEKLKQNLRDVVDEWRMLSEESSRRSKKQAAAKEEERTKTLQEQRKCLTCDGAGWVWGHELLSLSYDEESSYRHDYSSDDQRYTCDQCGGSGNRKEDDLDTFLSDHAAAERRAREEKE